MHIQPGRASAYHEIQKVVSADRPGKRWEEFARLLSSPRLPSGLR
jgi:hypothetical protein